MAPQKEQVGSSNSKRSASDPPSTDDDGTTSPPSHHTHKEVPLVELSLENVTYAPMATTASSSHQKSSEKARKTVLHSVTTKVRPFTLTAWMGPSGSGKTSLLSVAADFIESSDLMEGSLITVNGEEGRIPKRLVGVVWQDDLLLSNLTVEENVWYTARLKTPQNVTDEAVREIVHETIKDLGLWHVKDSVVGNPLGANGLMNSRGISGGERKRVAVANELVVRPSLLLLDEPTSGLDSTTSLALMDTLKQLANRGHSIAAVIHQPRTTIFQALDHLLLLSKGRVIYDGPPSAARQYLEGCSTVSPLPPETGIADWIMDIITHDEKQRKNGEAGALAEHWTAHGAQHTAQIVANKVDPHQDENKQTGEQHALRRKNSLRELESLPKYNTSFATQLSLLTQRTFKQQRGERLTSTAIVLQLSYLFFTALFWWQIPDSTEGIFQRNSLLFFMLIAQANGIVISAVTVFQRERTLLRRERAKKLYSVSAYFLGKTASDMTNNVLLPLLYCLIVYWTAGYRLSVSAYAKFALAFYLTLSTAQSMGLMLSVVIPSMALALVLAPPITLFFMIMGGFYIPLDDMHPGVEWLSWLSFARYGYSALVVNEYSGRDIECSDNSVSISIGFSGDCPVPGDDVLDSLGIRGVTGDYWFNIGMVVLLQLIFRLSAYILLRRSK
uniref:ABC transporter domain-containing protein n=1 Tax=Amphora coffeiformis TaxID=265554 RepID=A0A7S3LDG0_9STRA